MNTGTLTTAAASPAVMASAKALLAAGGISRTNREGVYRAQSSSGGSYLCSATWCQCEAADRGNACKHREGVKLKVCEQVRAQAAERGIVVLRGASGAELLGDDTELDLYGPAEHCGLDECDCAEFGN